MTLPRLFRLAASLLPLFAAGCAHPPVSRLSPEEREQVIALAQAMEASPLPDGVRHEVGVVEDIVVPSSPSGIACRIYRPAAPAVRGTVLLIHGGAFIVGSVNSSDNMARLLCSCSQANVLSIEYSLAPGAMYPTQLREIRSVMRWLSSEGPNVGLDSRPLAVCGDSAGGMMSAVIARESAPNVIALAVLINPVVDATSATVEDPEVRAFCEMVVKAYVPEGIDLKDPGLSPLLHDVPASHPPTFIAIGDSDAWRAEQDLYAEKLRVAGVKVEVFRAPTGHLGSHGAAASPLAVPTLTAAGQAIKAAFGG